MRGNSYIDYYCFISNEFMAYKDRVRYFNWHNYL